MVECHDTQQEKQACLFVCSTESESDQKTETSRENSSVYKSVYCCRSGASSLVGGVEEDGVPLPVQTRARLRALQGGLLRWRQPDEAASEK
jgi:hypothetical protein